MWSRGVLCFSILVLFVACAHRDMRTWGKPDGKVSIRPLPVEDSAGYPHRMAVKISPPWEEGGEWALRAPETVGSNRGLLFIDHWREDMIPVTWPRRPLFWKAGRDGALEYECELDMGILLKVRVVPGARDLTIESALINATETDLSNLGTQFCLVQSEVPRFVDHTAERTYVFINGNFVSLSTTGPGPAPGQKPLFIVTNTWDLEPWQPYAPGRNWFVQEQADIPLIATVSKEGEHIVAVAFDNAYKIMTNCDIPCIHADPQFPDCPAGEMVQIRGKVYFHEGSLDELLLRFAGDFPEWGYLRPRGTTRWTAAKDPS